MNFLSELTFRDWLAIATLVGVVLIKFNDFKHFKVDFKKLEKLVGCMDKKLSSTIKDVSKIKGYLEGKKNGKS